MRAKQKIIAVFYGIEQRKHTNEINLNIKYMYSLCAGVALCDVLIICVISLEITS